MSLTFVMLIKQMSAQDIRREEKLKYLAVCRLGRELVFENFSVVWCEAEAQRKTRTKSRSQQAENDPIHFCI